MTSRNRGRYVATPGGPWRLYTHPPPGWQMLGTIQRGLEIGALARSPAGDLVQLNAGAVRALDQRKATAALAAAQLQEHPDMPHQLARIIIPDTLDFSDLRLSRDPASGDVNFDWGPIEAICHASGLDVAMLRDTDEGNVAGLIVEWYGAHRAAGGAPDPAAEDLIAETRAEDAHGGGYSHQPGRA